MRRMPPASRAGHEARPEEGRQRSLLHLPREGHARAEQGPRPHRGQERAVRAVPQPSRLAGEPPPQGGGSARCASSATTRPTTAEGRRTRCCRRPGARRATRRTAPTSRTSSSRRRRPCASAASRQRSGLHKATAATRPSGLVLGLPQSPQFGAGQAAEDERARAVAGSAVREPVTRRRLGQAVRGDPEGWRTLPSCHDAADIKGDGKVKHLPFGRPVPACHNPHASENPKLLTARETACASRATRTRREPSAFTHAPVAADQGASRVTVRTRLTTKGC